MSKLIYFGCHKQSGHYWWLPGYRQYFNPPENDPWGKHVDSGLAESPIPGQVEGAAILHKLNLWTAIAFWDRSVDKRLGSNSVFLIDTFMDAEELLLKAAAAFPEVFERLNKPPLLARECKSCVEPGKFIPAWKHQLVVTGDCDWNPDSK